MGRITKTQGTATAQFVTPLRARAVARWTPEEQKIIDDAIASNLGLDETHALIPYRSYHSVKDRYYRSRGWTPPRDDAAKSDALTEARYQKDCRDGSEQLRQAIIEAGLWSPPKQRKIA